jgi:hypothetical protein
MLQSGVIDDAGKLLSLGTDVRGSERMPLVFQFWTAELARDVLRLGVYFSALGVMLQVPGAAEYEWVSDDELDDRTHDRVRESAADELLDVLAECLQRVGAPAELLRQVPGAADREPGEISAEWKQFLNERGVQKNGLLNVVAECLDELIVRPGLTEIDEPPELPWWQRWRPRPE